MENEKKGIRLWASAKEKLHMLSAWVERYQQIFYWVGAVLLRIALDLMYVHAASPSYAYAGLVLSPSPWKYVLSIVLYLGTFFLLPKKEKDAISFLLHLQFVLTVAPMLSFYALADQSTAYICMVCICIALQCLLVRKPQQGGSAVYVKGLKKPATVAILALTLVGLIVPVLYNGFEGLKAFDFTYIYEMRANATYPMGFGYLLSWLTKAILPFAVVWSLHKGKYLLGGALVAVEVLFFMLTGEKFILFVIIPLLGIYLLCKSGHLLKLMYGGVSLVFGAVALIFPIAKASAAGHMVCHLISVRTVFHPADNKFRFYEFFSEFPQIHFSDGLIGKMFGMTYPYAGSSGQVIFAHTGGEFLQANLNTGYLGESYAQLGFLGMLLMSLLFGLLLRVLRLYDSKQCFPLITAMFSVYVILLNDGALLTTLFSGGMMISLLLLAIYLKKPTEELNDGIQRV